VDSDVEDVDIMNTFLSYPTTFEYRHHHLEPMVRTRRMKRMEVYKRRTKKVIFEKDLKVIMDIIVFCWLGVMAVGRSCHRADYNNTPLGRLRSDALGMHGAHHMHNVYVFSEMPC